MTTEKPHPISLEQVLFVRSSVIAIAGHKPNGEIAHAQPENNIDVAPIEGQPGRYNASMRTIVNPHSEVTSPYFIDIECIAILSADDTLTQDDALRGVTITAHSVLYGAIREAVSWLTSRQPFGTLTLGLSILRPAAKAAQQTPEPQSPASN